MKPGSKYFFNFVVILDGKIITEEFMDIYFCYPVNQNFLSIANSQKYLFSVIKSEFSVNERPNQVEVSAFSLCVNGILFFHRKRVFLKSLAIDNISDLQDNRSRCP